MFCNFTYSASRRLAKEKELVWLSNVCKFCGKEESVDRLLLQCPIAVVT